MLAPVDYDRRQHAVYEQARALGSRILENWMAILARHLPAERPLTGLDLGSGTGRFTEALAGAFGGRVYGVEPSDGMRKVAVKNKSSALVEFLSGGAENVPLEDCSCDYALMFLSYHHFKDKKRAVSELARVLKADGVVLLRGEFSDRVEPAWWDPFFPSLWDVQQAMLPEFAETVHIFESGGFSFNSLDEVEDIYAPSYEVALDRVRLGGISTFDYLSAQEFEAGMQRIEQLHEQGCLDINLTGRGDLLVFRKKA